MSRSSPFHVLLTIGLFALTGFAALHAEPPIATDDRYATDEDRPLNIPVATGLLSKTLAATGSVWKYLNNGVDQGTAWRAMNFNDAGWPSGRAELGYGDAGFLGNNRPEATNIRPSGTPVRPAAYFRKEFWVTNANDTRTLTVEVLRDDGAAVYLNGVEIARQNLPTNAAYATLALAAVNGSDETRFFPEPADPAWVLEGRNAFE